MNETVKNRLLLLFALGLVAVYLLPLYWMYVTSLKTGSEMFATPPSFWPRSPQWDVFLTVWRDRAMASYLENSVIMASGVVLLVSVLGTGCAYVLCRYRNRWIDLSLLLILMFQAMPPSLVITPLFVMFNQVGLLDLPRLANVLAITAKSLPFYVVLVRAAMMSVPRELEEAAMVDGNSRFGAVVTVVLPLARNGVLVSCLLVFMQAFGEFVYAKSIIQTTALQPASVGLSTYMGPNSNEWNKIMAFASIYVTPIIATFVLLQRHIVSGLTSGALK